MRLKALLLALSLIMTFSAYYVGANKSYVMGYITGYNDAIFQGKVQISCHFPLNPAKHR